MKWLNIFILQVCYESVACGRDQDQVSGKVSNCWEVGEAGDWHFYKFNLEIVRKLCLNFREIK